METAVGSSPFSNVLTARTQHNLTKIDRLKESIEESSNATFQAMANIMASKVQRLDTSVTTVLTNISTELLKIKDLMFPHLGKLFI